MHAEKKMATKVSREMILKMADWIIPGHAGMYKTEKDNEGVQVELPKKKEPKLLGVCRK